MLDIACRAVIAVAAFSLTFACAHAGPCSSEIARIEEVMADPGPMTGPTNPQSLAAQLHRQPTASSVARAEKRAQSRFRKAMARARSLDAKDDPKCKSAVTEVKDLIGMQ